VRKHQLVRTVTVIGVLCGIMSSCSGTPSPHKATGGTASGTSARVFTPGALSQGLLRTADVPAGFRPWTPVGQVEATSTPPECARALNELEVDRPADPGASQTRVAFEESDSGPWIQEILRSYPPGHAKTEFTGAVHVLTSAACRQFTVDAAPTTATELISPLALPTLGSESWATRATYEGQQFTLTENLVLIRQGDLFGVLSFLGPEPPDPSRTTAIARAMLNRLRTLPSLR
jgi:hypothetical protein